MRKGSLPVHTCPKPNEQLILLISNQILLPVHRSTENSEIKIKTVISKRYKKYLYPVFLMNRWTGNPNALSVSILSGPHPNGQVWSGRTLNPAHYDRINIIIQLSFRQIVGIQCVLMCSNCKTGFDLIISLPCNMLDCVKPLTKTDNFAMISRILTDGQDRC